MHAMSARRALSLDDVRRIVPSAFAESAAPGRSDRYRFIPTSTVLEAVMREGFVPVAARHQRTRVPGKREFARHQIRFTRPEFLNRARDVGSLIPEVIITNSHDGTSAYSIEAGLFRLICSNGMTVADAGAGSIRVRHSGGSEMVREVIEGTFTVVDRAARAIETASEWGRIELARPEQLALATAAHQLRFGEAEVLEDGTTEASSPLAAAITPDRLLAARRWDDKGDDLWRVFNRVQENVVKGGIRAHVTTTDSRGRPTVRRASTRAVTGLAQDTAINRALWTLAAALADHKTTGRAIVAA